MKVELNVSLIILIITVITSIIGFKNDSLERKWIFNAYMIHKRREYWRFITSSFLHHDYMHLAFNMFALWMFGMGLEREFDIEYANNWPKHILIFLGLYIPACALSSFYTYEKQKNNIHYNAYGASGAVSGVVFAYIAVSPTTTFWILAAIPLPAFAYGFLFLLVSYVMARRAKDNIGHDAHFFGALYGLMYIFIVQPHKFRNFFAAITDYLTKLF